MNATEKIYKQIKRLQSVNGELESILATAGRDSETNYTPEYLNMLDDMKALRIALGGMLGYHQSVIMDVEYEMEPLPIKAPIPNQPALDELAAEIEANNPTDLVKDILEPFFKWAG